MLTFSIMCAGFTVVLALYMYQHRKVKVFKVASPIFLTITLLGCAFMYLEMAAIFPILDTYSCIATKWTRHMGFCVTYTALLMKTWRVSLTYRVKSAHKVKLTDKQLLQWMVPILLVMFIYLGTWTLSAPPTAERIEDQYGLIFKQCSYNWWDHSLAIGEVLFLAWGIRVCYNVRNAESLYNEAKLISYAIYNIALVNTTMVAFHLFIFPQAGPDIKYLLGFIRTQLSTSVTIALVFGPKVLRILRGQGDQWDQRARKRGITASFSLNGIGLVPEETADLYQENEELKEEIQKLAAQIEFMKIVHMEMNNRHLKPKPGGYFTMKSPLGKSFGGGGTGVGGTGGGSGSGSHRHKHTKDDSVKEHSGVTEDGHSGTNSCYSGTANSIGAGDTDDTTSPHHSSSNSATYTATDSTNHPSASYNINYSVNQPNRVKPTVNNTKNADQRSGINHSNKNNNNNNNIYNNGSSHGGSNVNKLPYTSVSPGSGDPVRMIAAAGNTSNDHDNCNNNQSKPSQTWETASIVVGKAPEEHNRLNNNHIVPRIGDGEGSSPVPSSVPSPTVSTRSIPRTDDVSIGPDCTTTIDMTDTTSTHTTSDTVDQRLPVYV
uniref:G-protein coupled receptors family 3 profile domain-containing protein n=1 Tax=Anopheles culicifacies TaxID=139723 RepID=A0A182M4P4_9DIPT